MKECPRNERFADERVGAGVRLMVRGGCLPVRGSEGMKWKYDDDKCKCGLVETEKHVLLRGAVRELRDGMEEYEIIIKYRVRSEKNNRKKPMRYLRVMWNSRQRHERLRECGLK